MPEGPDADTLATVAAALIAEQVRRDEDEPMRPARSAEDLLASLPLTLDGSAMPWAQTVELLREVLAATPTTSSRRFFNQLFGGRDPVATLAELTTVVSNTPMHTFKASGVQVLIECEVLRRMCTMAGMTEGELIVWTAPSPGEAETLTILGDEEAEYDDVDDFLLQREVPFPGRREYHRHSVTKVE